VPIFVLSVPRGVSIGEMVNHQMAMGRSGHDAVPYLESTVLYPATRLSRGSVDAEMATHGGVVDMRTTRRKPPVILPSR